MNDTPMDVKIGQVWLCIGYPINKGYAGSEWEIAAIFNERNKYNSKRVDDNAEICCNDHKKGFTGNDDMKVFHESYKLIFDPDLGGWCKDCGKAKVRVHHAMFARYGEDIKPASDRKCWSCV